MIQINARQQKLKFNKNSEGTYMYVMHVHQYSNLNAKKVIDEASAHSGIGKGALKGAWDAIGDVIRSWVTEGHSVTIPGLGTIRFSVQAKAVEDVNDVAKKLITSRKVVFTPDSDILATLRGTSVQITCIDKDGNVVKRVTDDASNETVEDPAGPARRAVRNDTLKWVLSEVLRDMREQGRVYIKYEVKQGCFHMTVR